MHNRKCHNRYDHKVPTTVRNKLKSFFRIGQAIFYENNFANCTIHCENYSLKKSQSTPHHSQVIISVWKDIFWNMKILVVANKINSLLLKYLRQTLWLQFAIHGVKQMILKVLYKIPSIGTIFESKPSTNLIKTRSAKTFLL